MQARTRALGASFLLCTVCNVAVTRATWACVLACCRVGMCSATLVHGNSTGGTPSSRYFNIQYTTGGAGSAALCASCTASDSNLFRHWQQLPSSLSTCSLNPVVSSTAHDPNVIRWCFCQQSPGLQMQGHKSCGRRDCTQYKSGTLARVYECYAWAGVSGVP